MTLPSPEEKLKGISRAAKSIVEHPGDQSVEEVLRLVRDFEAARVAV